MTRLKKADQYVVLVLLTALMGCALPTGRNEPASVSAATNPARTLPVTARAEESRPDSPTASKTLLVAYQAPVETPARAPEILRWTCSAAGRSPSWPHSTGPPAWAIGPESWRLETGSR